jgi:hypothetical protein
MRALFDARRVYASDTIDAEADPAATEAKKLDAQVKGLIIVNVSDQLLSYIHFRVQDLQGCLESAE